MWAKIQENGMPETLEEGQDNIIIVLSKDLRSYYVKMTKDIIPIIYQGLSWVRSSHTHRSGFQLLVDATDAKW